MTLSPEALHRFLAKRTNRIITLKINDNVRNMITCSRGPRRGEIRASVHHMFLGAPIGVRDALATFLVRPDDECRRIVREYIAEHTPALHASRRRSPGSPRGDHYDLAPIADRINQRYFDGRLRFTIEWGRRLRKPPRRIRQITLGACYRHANLVRMHPILDSPRVPQFFLEYVIFHELAHIAVPARRGADGRHLNHTREFYEVERSFPRYREAVAWQDANLDRLIRDYCRGRHTTPLPVARPRTRPGIMGRVMGQLRLFE